MVVGVARPRDIAFDSGSDSLYHCTVQKRPSPNSISSTFCKNGASCYKAGESFQTIIGTHFPPKSRLTNICSPRLVVQITWFSIAFRARQPKLRHCDGKEIPIVHRTENAQSANRTNSTATDLYSTAHVYACFQESFVLYVQWKSMTSPLLDTTSQHARMV